MLCGAQVWGEERGEERGDDRGDERDERGAWKRRRLDIKLESDDPNDNFCFPETQMRVKGPSEASR